MDAGVILSVVLGFCTVLSAAIALYEYVAMKKTIAGLRGIAQHAAVAVMRAEITEDAATQALAFGIVAPLAISISAWRSFAMICSGV